MEFWDDIKTATWTQRFVWANVALFLTSALVVEDTANAALFFLFVTGVVSLFRAGWPRELSRGEKWLLAAFALYFLVGVLSYNLGLKTRLGWEIIFRDIRFLFAIPAYIALRRYPPPGWLLWSSLVIGAFGLAGVSLFSYLTAGADWRVDGATISIVFGHLAVSIALACAAGAVFLHAVSKRNIWRLLLCLGVLTTSIAVVLSGTRGAWVALLGAGGLLLLYWWWRVNWRERTLSVLAIVIVVFLAGVFLYNPIISRFHYAVDSWQKYQKIQAELELLDLPVRGCVNHQDFLEIYITDIFRSNNKNIKISVIEDQSINEYCQKGSVIRLQNRSNVTGYVAAFRLIDPDTESTKSVWWVKGTGAMRLGGAPVNEPLEIKADKFRRIVLNDSTIKYWPSSVYFFIPAGESLFAVPVQVNPGEYTMFYTASSLVGRLHMWEAAPRVFAEHPILGSGSGSWQQSVQPYIASGDVSPIVGRFDHAHNDYLTMLADRGLFGLATLLLLYGVPLWLFICAACQSRSGKFNPVAMAGVVVIGGFMLSGLTETLFNHSIVITYYSLFISILIVLARQQAETDESDHARNL